MSSGRFLLRESVRCMIDVGAAAHDVTVAQLALSIGLGS
jgi:hypothetical protein